MRRFVPRLYAVCLSVLILNTAAGQKTAADAYEKLKSMSGTWLAEGPQGLQVTITYEVVSGGEALMETRVPVGEPSMVTLFHLNGESLMMTHYCSAGNQPRMRAGLLTEDTIRFDFIDVTNLKGESDGHMSGLGFDFMEDRIIQTWTWRQERQETPAVFTLVRKE